MAQIILTFGLGKEKIKVVRSIAQKNRIQIKEISRKDYNQKLGALAGIQGFAKEKVIYNGPAEIEEAAKIDGCSRVAIFLRIILPMSKPGLASLAIFTFVNSWKSFFWPLIVTSSDKYKTLPIGLYAFSGQYGTDWSALMAATAISIIPGVIFYIIFQKSLVEGISLTGMGGR